MSTERSGGTHYQYDITLQTESGELIAKVKGTWCPALNSLFDIKEGRFRAVAIEGGSHDFFDRGPGVLTITCEKVGAAVKDRRRAVPMVLTAVPLTVCSDCQYEDRNGHAPDCDRADRV